MLDRETGRSALDPRGMRDPGALLAARTVHRTVRGFTNAPHVDDFYVAELTGEGNVAIFRINFQAPQ